MSKQIDTKVLEDRKVEIEKEFNDKEAQRKQLTAQIQLFTKGLEQIRAEQNKLTGAYIEVCSLLGLDPKDKENLSIKPEGEKKEAETKK